MVGWGIAPIGGDIQHNRGDEIMAKTMSPAEIAVEFDSTGREVRKFLRSITPKDEQPGKGSRWSVAANANQLKKLRKQFDEWALAKAEKVDEPETDDETPEVDETEDA
jgi:hypothetical protein